MNENGSNVDLGRREFLTTGARWTVAGVLVGGTVWGVLKAADGSCRQASPCGTCPVLQEGCGLPKATEWRRTTKEGLVEV